VTGRVVRLGGNLLVTGYLLGVGGVLRLRGRIPAPGLRRLVRARLRPPYRGPLAVIRHERGHCYTAPVPPELLSDQDGWSRLVVLENGQPLATGHSAHAEIRAVGLGRYSHWGAEIYFSTSDNSDPTRNGRRYAVEER
jgi:hypothetical protein